ncbi:type II toxin-antitoxin system RelE/ParE family toxin [Salegentibacter echinorum]|nr:type II toxin-antitoxin system RelE/ParE family toxin [Salegentibacter echinorum]
MDFEIIISPRASFEIDKALSWYSAKETHLGLELLDEINTEFKLLSSNPFLFPETKKKYREVPLRRFPYIIIYRIFRNDILIQSVFNTHQNPIKKP